MGQYFHYDPPLSLQEWQSLQSPNQQVPYHEDGRSHSFNTPASRSNEASTGTPSLRGGFNSDPKDIFFSESSSDDNDDDDDSDTTIRPDAITRGRRRATSAPVTAAELLPVRRQRENEMRSVSSPPISTWTPDLSFRSHTQPTVTPTTENTPSAPTHEESLSAASEEYRQHQREEARSMISNQVAVQEYFEQMMQTDQEGDEPSVHYGLALSMIERLEFMGRWVEELIAQRRAE
ncbi:hypothetical protein EJ04DRAFT_568102 [Polyplosphaeria fusca]|uniref:Uncharacterized protein n=1 Tax=Polyplosphaeria fusca TaxID=682080 RepID=A0A9P4UZA6_9PLEO|nr:hypothetical protein EJ04DRAFT_568102 [Polyplosphaeria fusca]